MPSTMECKLGELLVQESVISQGDLDSALQTQKSSGSSLGRVLQDMGLTSEWEMAVVLCKQFDVPLTTLSQYEIAPEVLESIPQEIVRTYKVVPVERTGDTLTVALSDPANIYRLDELRLLTNLQIVPVISFESDIAEAIERYYPADSAKSPACPVKKTLIAEGMLEEFCEEIEKAVAKLRKALSGKDETPEPEK